MILRELLTRHESGIAALWEGERGKHKSDLTFFIGNYRVMYLPPAYGHY